MCRRPEHSLLTAKHKAARMITPFMSASSWCCSLGASDLSLRSSFRTEMLATTRFRWRRKESNTEVQQLSIYSRPILQYTFTQPWTIKSRTYRISLFTLSLKQMCDHSLIVVEASIPPQAAAFGWLGYQMRSCYLMTPLLTLRSFRVGYHVFSRWNMSPHYGRGKILKVNPQDDDCAVSHPWNPK